MINLTLLTSILISYNIPKNDIKMLECIAQKESNMNSKAKNHNKNGTYDHGLFQINDVNKKLCKTTTKQLYNVHSNVRCAVKVYKVQNLKAWTTYKICKKELRKHGPSYVSFGSEYKVLAHSIQERQSKIRSFGIRRRDICEKESSKYYSSWDYSGA